MTQVVNTRYWAAQVMYQVLHKQVHLKAAIKNTLPQQIASQDKAWIQNLCYQTIRHHQNLTARWQKFTPKPVKDALLAELLTLSVAQKIILNTPDHAIVNEAIKAAKKLKKHWATGLINKVLKLTITDQEFAAESEPIIYNHAQWWIDLLRKDWPDHWQQIIQANNQKPPLWIRTNDTQTEPAGKQHNTIASAWLLDDEKASLGESLKAGKFSVQDAAAQYAALLLKPQTGEKILDACAAPGGKSCHLLELNQDIELDVLEKEPSRLKLVNENLDRLNLKAARVILGDATCPNDWFQSPKYDKILLDVPCSAAGVVRRNPDIKLLRAPEHLKQLTQLQQQILQNIAQLLKVGGHILYVTCSVFRSENERQIKKFLKNNNNFTTVPMDITAAEPCAFGQQIITGTDNMDGFYYCLMSRTA
ncbi:16S rRNA (cytosine(967)-C(5))-methyltransferase RsmB [Marinicella sp. S1101]|uniref:16S rRNA (cytosine(967)-C(5))-methyltransferase RsmB n=1 Tax=Marinicella marina TaxID=2996016 RepID=UPI002260A2B2|nr:16S rRNA (cytosine(967)-C(5))-methyltransferase RsmB [Marinicella marina]MCX7552879.1 16S rRNA (cytosine(967)-C(5))-methyltransferase RsmB [Marinicella marina]MDJ1139812.1 16S rRNA (cytosine(967)-C(5))-methyltransferase RsmB [Marinicella marina]